MRWIALLLGGALAATYVSPAVGGPDLAGHLRRVDQREQRHYGSLDRRIKATVLLAQSQQPRNAVTYAAMTSSADGRFYSGRVSCSTGTLAGGGVDWGTSLVDRDWHVISSAPTLGGAEWTASVGLSGSAAPTDTPKVYAVCVS